MSIVICFWRFVSRLFLLSAVVIYDSMVEAGTVPKVKTKINSFIERYVNSIIIFTLVLQLNQIYNTSDYTYIDNVAYFIYLCLRFGLET